MINKPVESFASVGEQLRAMRKRKGLSVADLEKRWGVSSNTIYKWETGTQPNNPKEYLGLLAFLRSGELESFTNVEADLENLLDYWQSNQGMPPAPVSLSLAGDEGVPIYDAEFSMGTAKSLIEARADVPIVGRLSLPEVAGCDAIIRGARGMSMSDFINEGDWVGLKKVIDMDFIFWDYPYGIVTDEIEVIKYIRRGSSNKEVVLASHNPAYSDVVLPKKKITHLFLVKVVLPFSKIKTVI
jgi:transcriptional regulator with XRE-family HTH domain